MALVDPLAEDVLEFNGVRLGWLLHRPDLGLRLIEPSEPIEYLDTQVRFAHAIELEDPSPWLSGGELVLTTGLRLPRSRAEQVAYVERLVAVGVAGLAFGVGVRFETVPPMIRQTCARLGLPLIEVPLPTPFVAIAQAVADQLAVQRHERSRRAVAFQELMTRAALQHGTRGLLEVLTRELSCAAVVVDNYLGLLEQSAVAPGTLDRIRHEISAHSDRPGPTSVNVVDEHGSLEIHRLGGKESARGWLAVADAGRLEATDRMLLNQAASMITLQLDRPRELAEAHRRLGSTVLELLFDSEVAQSALVHHLGHFGFGPNDAVRVLLVGSEGDPTPLFTLVSERLATASRPHVATPAKEGAFAVTLSTEAHDAVVEILQALQQAGRHDVTIGVSGSLHQSRVSAGRTAAHRAVTSARWAHQPVAWFDELSLDAILADDAVRSRIRMLAESPLGPLLGSQSSQHRTLVDSLEIYLRHNGSWETASRALGVHRHTLRKRMAKVEELTGTRLDVAENRVALLLALLAREQ